MSEKVRKADMVRELIRQFPNENPAEIARKAGCDSSYVRQLRKREFVTHPVVANKQFTRDSRVKNPPEGKKGIPKREFVTHRASRKEFQGANHTEESRNGNQEAWLSLAPFLVFLVVAFSVYQSGRSLFGSTGNLWAAGWLGTILSLAVMLSHGYGAKAAGFDWMDAIAVLASLVSILTGVLWFVSESHNQNADAHAAAAKLSIEQKHSEHLSEMEERRIQRSQRRRGETAKEWQRRIGVDDDGKIGNRTSQAFRDHQKEIYNDLNAQMRESLEAQKAAAVEKAKAKRSSMWFGGLGLMFLIQILVNMLEMIVPRKVGLHQSPKTYIVAGLAGAVLGVAYLAHEHTGWVTNLTV